MIDWDRQLDAHDAAIEAECVPLNDLVRHLHTALVALTRAQETNLGWLRDLEIARAADALRCAGRVDLAERIEGASPFAVGPADGVLSELWRAGWAR